MKKNVLALSIAAAVAGLGAMGSAHAIDTVLVPGADVDGLIAGKVLPAGAAAATGLARSATGTGNLLVVPYYTAQGTNATLVNLVNTDEVNGKAVKLRFRGAANSDDVFDFQVFLSPADVWTANISASADGFAQILSNDNSCMKGLTKGVATKFSTLRTGGGTNGNSTREGYLEILNMADIPAVNTVVSTTGVAIATGANAVYNGVLHNAGTATCAGLTGLDSGNLNGLSYPTTGLAANWIIINLATAAAFGGEADAAALTGGAPAVGNIVYFPQTNVLVGTEVAPAFTADDLLTSGKVLALQQDLPDLSTPYVSSVVSPLAQSNLLAGAFLSATVGDEYLVDSATLKIGAATDIVYSFPTRRYSVTTAAATLAGKPTTAFAGATFSGSCLVGITVKAYDQNEQTPSTVVPSPSAIPQFCGEVGVAGVNQVIATGGTTAVLGANISSQGLDATYNAGWLKVGFGRPLPVLGGRFTIAASGTSNFGVNSRHITLN
ncbi:MAG: hypothetical protein Fur007_15420 [Rhodoferax sp.]